MPTYWHACSNCEHEWEQFYGINDDIPQECPSCNVVGKVRRLISGGSGKGIVRLTGYELKAKIKEDAANMNKEVYKNEKLLANIVGEDKYHSNELERAKRR